MTLILDFDEDYAMDFGIVHKSLIDVTVLSRRHSSSYVINPTFILNPLTYLQVCTLSYIQVRVPLSRGISIYI